MEIWRGHRISLEQLKERKQGDLSTAQETTLTDLIREIQIAELAGKPPSIRRVKKLASGLLIGQHLEEPEITVFNQFVNPPKRR